MTDLTPSPSKGPSTLRFKLAIVRDILIILCIIMSIVLLIVTITTILALVALAQQAMTTLPIGGLLG